MLSLRNQKPFRTFLIISLFSYDCYPSLEDILHMHLIFIIYIDHLSQHNGKLKLKRDKNSIVE